MSRRIGDFLQCQITFFKKAYVLSGGEVFGEMK